MPLPLSLSSSRHTVRRFKMAIPFRFLSFGMSPRSQFTCVRGSSLVCTVWFNAMTV